MDVAPHAGAWIETHREGRENELDRSHPMRVRGLKQPPLFRGSHLLWSHPMRVRGLKQYDGGVYKETKEVAPHAGAWIETDIDDT